MWKYYSSIFKWSFLILFLSFIHMFPFFFLFSFSLVFSPLHRHIHISQFSPFFNLYFPLDSRTSLSLSPFLLCLPFCFYFLSSSAHFTHTVDHDLLTSPLCLHFCFLFSFFFISLHSHTAGREIGLRLSFLFFFFFLLLFLFWFTLLLQWSLDRLSCPWSVVFVLILIRFVVLIKFVFFPILDLLLCLCFDCITVWERDRWTKKRGGKRKNIFFLFSWVFF